MKGGLSLSVDFDAAFPRALVSDPGRVRQVLINLVGNALKFTAQGGVRVVFEVCDEGRWRGQVIDTGIGLSPEVQGRLFTQFTQADASTSRRFGGTGLGLSISQRLVALMGGTIGVESAPGKGSTFWFELPLVEGHLVVPRLSPAPVSVPRGLRVLVAEDNAVNQRLVRVLLEKLGCEVQVVGDGAAAIAAHQAQRFDVTLMDCHMPEVDGFAATAEVRRQEQAQGRARCPIIALTASVMQSDRERCDAAGMDGFLTKPINLAALAEALARSVPDRPTLLAS